MKYEIELPDRICDAYGTQFEPVGVFRSPGEDEYFLNDRGNVELSEVALHCNPRIILRPTWTWPSWLGGWGIAMSKAGVRCWFSHPAQLDGSYWKGVSRHQDEIAILPVHVLALVYQGFTPPFITDWTKPVINPNWKDGGK